MDLKELSPIVTAVSVLDDDQAIAKQLQVPDRLQ